MRRCSSRWGNCPYSGWRGEVAASSEVSPSAFRQRGRRGGVAAEVPRGRREDGNAASSRNRPEAEEPGRREEASRPGGETDDDPRPAPVRRGAGSTRQLRRESSPRSGRGGRVSGDDERAERLGPSPAPEGEDFRAPAHRARPSRVCARNPASRGRGPPTQPARGGAGRDRRTLGRGGGSGGRTAERDAELQRDPADGEAGRKEEAEGHRIGGAHELEVVRAARRPVLPDGGEEGVAGAAASRPGRDVEVENDEDVPPDDPGREAEKRPISSETAKRPSGSVARGGVGAPSPRGRSFSGRAGRTTGAGSRGTRRARA